MATIGSFLFLFKSKYRRKRPSLNIFWPLFLLGLGAVNGVLPENSSPGPRPCSRDCVNGECVVIGAARAVGQVTGGQGQVGQVADLANTRCACWEGWRGERCDLCGGKIKMNETGPRRWIAEAAGNYTTNMKCTWFIETERPNSTIRLHLTEFATECGWDHLYVWDGDNIFDGLQAVYSGLVRQDPYRTSRVPEILGHSGSMLLHFYSDVAYNMTGG